MVEFWHPSDVEHDRSSNHARPFSLGRGEMPLSNCAAIFQQNGYQQITQNCSRIDRFPVVNDFYAHKLYPFQDEGNHAHLSLATEQFDGWTQFFGCAEFRGISQLLGNTDTPFNIIILIRPHTPPPAGTSSLSLKDQQFPTNHLLPNQ